MSWADFQVGRRVVCLVDHSHWVALCSVVPRKGQVYTIRATMVGQNSAGATVLGLLFCEFVSERIGDYAYVGGEWAFAATDFRPVDERRLDQFRQLLVPLPAPKVRAPA